MAIQVKAPANGWLDNLLAKFGKPVAQPAKAAAAKRAKLDHWVDLDLDQMLTAEPDMPVHIVSLRDYRFAIGPSWDALRSKIMTLAESILHRLVQQGASVTPREDFFIVTFKPQFRAKGRQRVAAAAVELGQRLVGAKFKGAAGLDEPVIGLAEANAAELLGPNGILDPVMLDAIVATADAVRESDDPLFAAIEAAVSAPEPTVGAIEPGKRPSRAEWEAMERERQARQVTMVAIDAPTRKRADPVWVPIEKKG